MRVFYFSEENIEERNNENSYSLIKQLLFKLKTAVFFINMK